MNYSTISSTYTDFTQRHIQNEAYRYFKANLSDIIEDIETASVLDIFQLIFEVIVTIFCIGGSFLTILVLRRAALKHPAQALRLTMAVNDLIIGIFGCATSVGFHSYYLWCAIDKQRCQYEVNVIQFNDNSKIFIVHRTFPLLYFSIYWIAIKCNVYLTTIMSLERYFAICRPLKQKIYFSMSNICKIVVILPILMTVESYIWTLLETTHLRWNSFFTPEFKHFTHLHTNQYYTFIQKIWEVCSMIFNVALSLIFASIIISKLRKTKVKRDEIILKKERISTPSNKLSQESNTVNKVNVSAENQVHENLIDMTITHVWLIIVEVSAFAINALVLASLYNIAANLKEPEKLHPILHASGWLLLSSSSFNFIVYNVRIPAFRKASWGIITYLPRWFIGLGIPRFVKVMWDAVTYFRVCLIEFVTLKSHPLKCSSQHLDLGSGGAEVQVNIPQLIHVKKTLN